MSYRGVGVGNLKGTGDSRPMGAMAVKGSNFVWLGGEGNEIKERRATNSANLFRGPFALKENTIMGHFIGEEWEQAVY